MVLMHIDDVRSSCSVSEASKNNIAEIDEAFSKAVSTALG